MKAKLTFTVLAAAAFVSFGAQARDAAAVDPWSPAALAERAGAGAISSDVRSSDGAGYRDEWSPSVLRTRFAGTSEHAPTQSMLPGAGYHDEWSPAALATRFGGAAAQRSDTSTTMLRSSDLNGK